MLLSHVQRARRRPLPCRFGCCSAVTLPSATAESGASTGPHSRRVSTRELRRAMQRRTRCAARAEARVGAAAVARAQARAGVRCGSWTCVSANAQVRAWRLVERAPARPRHERQPMPGAESRTGTARLHRPAECRYRNASWAREHRRRSAVRASRRPRGSASRRARRATACQRVHIERQRWPDPRFIDRGCRHAA